MQQQNSPSTLVASSQVHPHRNLLRKLSRYKNSIFFNSIPNYARDEFIRLKKKVGRNKIILDSGCGTGESTLKLAQLFPDSVIVGVDKSAHRLRRTLALGKLPENLIFIRCELIHFWQLLCEAGWQLDAHYLLYPNPWPKPGHLTRRWHAHPIFPSVIQLGGMITMRTNWHVYANEFAIALQQYLCRPVKVSQLSISDPISAFEKKYWQSGHPLFEVRINASLDQTVGRPVEPAIPHVQHYD